MAKPKDVNRSAPRGSLPLADPDTPERFVQMVAMARKASRAYAERDERISLADVDTHQRTAAWYRAECLTLDGAPAWLTEDDWMETYLAACERIGTPE